MLPALLPLAISLIPDAAAALGRLFAGDRGAEMGEAFGGAVRQVIGTDDPQEAGRILATDSAAATQLRVELTRIMAEQAVALAQAENEAARIAAGDTADSRAAVVREMEAGGSPAMRDWVAKAAVLIFCGAGFGNVVALTVSTDPLVVAALSAVMGYASAGYQSVLGHFLGSTTSSRAKDAVLAATVMRRGD